MLSLIACRAVAKRRREVKEFVYFAQILKVLRKRV
jgi:hypothetical protein